MAHRPIPLVCARMPGLCKDCHDFIGGCPHLPDGQNGCQHWHSGAGPRVDNQFLTLRERIAELEAELATAQAEVRQLNEDAATRTLELYVLHENCKTLQAEIKRLQKFPNKLAEKGI